ncbi:helix-turn-helix domain-containing protein [Actinoplanes sp. NPDC051851]|uniref:helix-turn-helix domain-containing protein n=1 Tax=Actinoplanes sp. NPDC051851 TaxID=3154753 RepID=UPI00342726F1
MRQVFEASDVEHAEHVLRETYGGNIRVDTGRVPAGIRLETAPIVPGLRLDQIDLGLDFGLRAEPLGVLVICRIRSGSLAYRCDGGPRSYGPGDVFIPVRPDEAYAVSCAETDFTTAVLDPALPGRMADTEPGRRPEPVRFSGHAPLSLEAAQTWNLAYRYVREAISCVDEAIGGAGEMPPIGGPVVNPLLADSATRLLVATALTVFPNNALADPTIEDRRDAHPVTLRRAVAFIDENAHREIALADIAAAAHVTGRSLQLSFRRHLNITPMGYLRRVRLEHAHRDLLAADPAATTVIAVAARWGFLDHSRFAAAHHQAYGASPAQALRDGAG